MPLAPAKPAPRRSTQARTQDLAVVTFESNLGWMAIGFRGEVLVGVVFGHANRESARTVLERYLRAQHADLQFVDFVTEEQLTPVIENLVDRLKAYAAGAEVDFSDGTIDDRHLTDFGRKIVKACRRIPRGKTRGYGELAAHCGSPGAARAVGQVMARNRFPLVVPCHRVLAAGGLIGGFSAPQGLSMKRRLLALEQALA